MAIPRIETFDETVGREADRVAALSRRLHTARTEAAKLETQLGDLRGGRLVAEGGPPRRVAVLLADPSATVVPDEEGVSVRLAKVRGEVPVLSEALEAARRARGEAAAAASARFAPEAQREYNKLAERYALAVVSMIEAWRACRALEVAFVEAGYVGTHLRTAVKPVVTFGSLLAKHGRPGRDGVITAATADRLRELIDLPALEAIAAHPDPAPAVATRPTARPAALEERPFARQLRP